MPIRPQFETDAEWLDHLRMWFAGQALAGVYGVYWSSAHATEREKLATLAYELADAMLAARKRS